MIVLDLVMSEADATHCAPVIVQGRVVAAVVVSEVDAESDGR